VKHLRSLEGPNPAVAVVGTPPVVDGFGVQVAQNLGALVLLFSNAEKAKDWLETLR
jgi:hypothetical protein